MKEKILSVVIPTKNRQKYCIEAVKHMCSFCRNELEIIIYDNSDEPILRNQLAKIDDKGTLVSYYYDPETLSFSENFNRAISKATGEYICLIGDDDSILVEIFDVVKFAKKENIDSIVSSKALAFRWPVDQLDKGSLFIPEYSYSYKIVKNKESLQHLLNNSFQSYNDYGVPRIYHGLIHKKVLSKLKDKGFQLFGGISPDIYSSILLSFELEYNVIIGYPFTIAGASPKSGSAASSKGTHCGKLSEAPHFNGLSDYIWPDILPNYYSVETVWAEAGIQAFKDTGNQELLNKFNIQNILGQSYLNNKTIRSLILHSEKEHRESFNQFLQFWFYVLKYSYKRIQKRFFNFTKRKLFPRKLKVVKKCQNLYAVENIWNEYKKSNINKIF